MFSTSYNGYYNYGTITDPQDLAVIRPVVKSLLQNNVSDANFTPANQLRIAHAASVTFVMMIDNNTYNRILLRYMGSRVYNGVTYFVCLGATSRQYFIFRDCPNSGPISYFFHS